MALSFDAAYLAQNRGPAVIAVISVFAAVATITVVLRLISRKVSQVPLWWDDFFIVFALVSTVNLRGVPLVIF